jgi:hypothetical protein
MNNEDLDITFLNEFNALLNSRHVPEISKSPNGFLPDSRARQLGSTIIEQLGFATLAAISGGRWFMIDAKTVRLPMRNGWAVDVEYSRGDDAYIVKRVFVRKDRTSVKGSVREVYFVELSEVAYEASLYLMGDFGD